MAATSPVSRARADLLAQIADLVPEPSAPSCVRVAVDGVDGSGKSVFAGQLADELRTRGRPVAEVSLDDFHHVRAIRYRRGRTSPVGFWLDSFDHQRFVADVMAPLGPGGSGRYRPRLHDLATDEILDVPTEVVTPGSVLLVDGLFLHREELAEHWDFSIFLQVPFEKTARRMAARDGSDPDPAHPSMERYVEAQRLYYAERTPWQRATVVVDNADLERPRLVPARSSSTRRFTVSADGASVETPMTT